MTLEVCKKCGLDVSDAVRLERGVGGRMEKRYAMISKGFEITLDTILQDVPVDHYFCVSCGKPEALG